MLDRLSLIQWLSPAFPTGGFAYSHGLEQAMNDGVGTASAVSGWIQTVLQSGGGWTDAVLLALVLRGEDAEEVAGLALALAGSAERVTETLDQGAAFAATVAAMTGRVLAPRPLPVAVGEAARALDLPADEIIAHYLHGFSGNLVSAATRFLPLGQAQSQGVLAGLHTVIAETAARAAVSDREALASCCFGADLAAMRHETLDIRIFRT